MKARIDPKTVAKLKPGGMISDIEVRGFRARCWPTGDVTYDFRYRTMTGQRRSIHIGRHGDLSIEQARTLAKKRSWEVANERDPAKEQQVERATASNTVSAIWDEYTKRELKSKRSCKEQTSSFDRLARPRIGNKPIYELKRGDIIKMLDTIADDNGAVMADRMLAYLGACFRWQQIRDEDFVSPIITGMARTSAKELARDRILTDDELRSIWTATAEGTFGALVRFLLLTAARRSEAVKMTWSELDGATWTLPATRNKVKAELVRPLSKAACTILTALPRNGDYVFPVNGKWITGLSYRKDKLDSKSGVTDWRLHDLRRTARSLMSRAGVNSDHAEQCLGHVIAGVKGTYDRHAYVDEKHKAFEALAAQIERILNPSDNVTSLTERKARV
jgi:integrase